MLFGTFAFAETAFAADRLIIGTFPIFPFNQHTLTFVMSLNFESGFSLSTNRQFDYNFVR